jgi:hypothetical protein
MLPEFVTAIKTFTYNTTVIQEHHPEWTDAEIIEFIDTMSYDDLGEGFSLVDPDTMEEL